MLKYRLSYAHYPLKIFISTRNYAQLKQGDKMNKLATTLIQRALKPLDNQAKLAWLEENCTTGTESGFEYLPKFFMFEYKIVENVTLDNAKFLVVKVSFGVDYSDITLIEYFDNVADYIQFSADNCDVSSSDLFCSDLDIIFSYAHKISLDDICYDIGYYVVDETEDHIDARVFYIVTTPGGFFHEVTKSEYSDSSRKAGIIANK